MLSAGPHNIVLIVADDLGWSQLATPMDPRVAGASSGFLETPSLTRFARRGMRFTNGYAPAPICTPTRRSILCGMSAARTGTEFRSSWQPARHLTMPKALRMANPKIRTAHFGKWGGAMGSTPAECGFDTSDGATTNDTGGMPATLRRPFGRYRWHHTGPPHFLDEEDAKRTRSVTDRSVQFLGECARADRPFYLQISYYATHLSVVCRQATLAKFERKGDPDRRYSAAWAAMLAEMDAGVGRVLDALEELDLDESTFVFFIADNGGRWSIPGADPSRTPTNAPLLGAKQSLYEGGIRVPFLVAGPGLRVGARCDEPVVAYDFLPTFFELCGASPAAVHGAVDGVSMVPLLRDPSAQLARPQGGIFFHRPRRLESAMRMGRYKLLLHWNRDGTVASHSLYDLARSPSELEADIAWQQPGRAAQMRATLRAFLRSVDAETSDQFPDR